MRVKGMNTPSGSVSGSGSVKDHLNVLWLSKMGPRSIPKRHGKRQNFKAAADAWRLTLGVGIA